MHAFTSVANGDRYSVEAQDGSVAVLDHPWGTLSCLWTGSRVMAGAAAAGALVGAAVVGPLAGIATAGAAVYATTR